MDKGSLWRLSSVASVPSMQQDSNQDNFYAEYIMRNAGLEEARAGIKIGNPGSSLQTEEEAGLP